jgi:transporter family-2 protein
MILFLLLALAAGVLLPVQAGLNAQLRSALGSPVAAALVSFLVGTAGLTTTALLLRTPLPLATLIAAVVAGQMITSLVLDQYGMVGFPVHSLTPARLLGAVLVIAGVILIQR